MERKWRDLFVYGTLRVGEYNDQALGLSGLAQDVVQGVETTGVMRNRRGSRPVFPVVDFFKRGRVVGDVLVGLPADHEAVLTADEMERGAGYELVKLYVPHFGLVDAYNFSNRYGLGAVIDDGDWLRYDREWRALPA